MPETYRLTPMWFGREINSISITTILIYHVSLNLLLKKKKKRHKHTLTYRMAYIDKRIAAFMRDYKVNLNNAFAINTAVQHWMYMIFV